MASNRISIKAFLLPYVEQIGKQIGTDDVSEIVSQIILDHKRGCPGVVRQSESQSALQNTSDSLLDELSELI